MKVAAVELPGVRIMTPRIFEDPRGYFFESFRADTMSDAGVEDQFVQDNVSFSRRGVLRGLHFQHPRPQGKLVAVLAGEVYDVAVDVRIGSPTFGNWVGEYLSAETHRMLYLPPGFAHGFVVTSDEALFLYKCTDYYHPEAERSIRWNDGFLGIDWPVQDVELSDKDRAAPALADLNPSDLPLYRDATAPVAIP